MHIETLGGKSQHCEANPSIADHQGQAPLHQVERSGSKGHGKFPHFFSRKIMSEQHMEYGMALFVHSASQNGGSSIFFAGNDAYICCFKKKHCFSFVRGP